jgi:hypothetical protein
MLPHQLQDFNQQLLAQNTLLKRLLSQQLRGAADPAACIQALGMQALGGGSTLGDPIDHFADPIDPLDNLLADALDTGDDL